MKKYILLFAISYSFIACNKSEKVNSKAEYSTSDTIGNLDSLTQEKNQLESEPNLDSTQNIINDVKEHTKLKDSVSTNSSDINSITKKEIKKDSSNVKQDQKIVKAESPKIIKETKIIYKNSPQKKAIEPKDKLLKIGLVELEVEDAFGVKELIKDDLKKYDGTLKSENSSIYNNRKTVYIKAKVPIQKFDYLIDDLSNNYGDVLTKNIEITGSNLVNNALCDVEITLKQNLDNAYISASEKTFGEKFFDSIDKGWNAITSIFLFFLPLWPIFILAAIAYYFYKKKYTNQKNEQS